MEYQISCSIVLYKNNREVLYQAITSFLNTRLSIKLFLVDNSPSNALQVLEKIDYRIEYIFNNCNIGFGAGHNIAIKKAIELNYKYHLILNPDVFFEKGNLEQIFHYMENNIDVGIVSPRTLYPSGELQYLCRLLPTPFDFFAKRFIPDFLLPLWKDRIDAYEFKNRSYENIMEVPFLSGCFMFTRTCILKDTGLFDENIFMYTEDIDLCRRVHIRYKTIYYPYAKIIHGYERGSTKNLKLFWISIRSAIYYFNKWGWFWDKNRDEINNKIINQFK